MDRKRRRPDGHAGAGVVRNHGLEDLLLALIEGNWMLHVWPEATVRSRLVAGALALVSVECQAYQLGRPIAHQAERDLIEHGLAPGGGPDPIAIDGHEPETLERTRLVEARGADAHPLAKAQPEHDPLLLAHLGTHRLRAGYGELPIADGPTVRGDPPPVPVPDRDCTRFDVEADRRSRRRREVTVCPDTRGRVVPVVPVDEVVAALLPAEGEVADLVLGVAGALQHLDGDAVLAHRASALDRSDQPPSHAGVQRRPGLNGQFVARDMGWPRRDHTLEGAPPADVPEARHGVDEVAVDRGEARLIHLGNRVDGAAGVMNPSEEPQRVGLETLHADADPVDPSSLPHACATG